MKMLKEYQTLLDKAKSQKKQMKKFLTLISKKPPKKIDKIFQECHEKTFQEIDCLECGNCCRVLGPRITNRDLERIPAFFKISKDEFIKKYLRIDEDGDYVFNTLPCPFLDEKNYCFIYEVRPKACKEYPHSDAKYVSKQLKLLEKNIEYCPALFEIVESVKDSIK